MFNSSPAGQNGRLFADAIFICIFVNEKLCIMVKISLKFVPKSPIDNKPAFVQVMAWCWTGNKPLPGPMMTQFTDIYVALGGDELMCCSWDVDLCLMNFLIFYRWDPSPCQWMIPVIVLSISSLVPGISDISQSVYELVNQMSQKLYLFYI